MSDTKFTQGKWIVRDNKVFVGKRTLCEVHAAEELNIGEMVTRRNANAALIAAAPELYAALDLLRTMSGILKLSYNGPHDPVQTVFDIADAALKKARGEA